MIDSNRVEQVLRDCTADQADGVKLEGVLNTYFLDRNRVETYRDEIQGWIDQLDDSFIDTKGGGWSFLNLCMCKDGQWTGVHAHQEQLCVLAMMLGQAAWVLPREMWGVFPGAMPYVAFRLATDGGAR